jgi:hypothetical protein
LATIPTNHSLCQNLIIERPEADSALPLGIQEPEVLMANDPKTDEAQGKRDTEGRPVLTDKDEKKRQEEESKEKPVDPE